jgi:large subunit ribosomal protein L35
MNSMPKLKSRSGVAKRFTVTKRGKIKRSKAFTSHLLTGKSASRKRGLRQATLVSKADAQRIKKLIPYI